MLGKKKKLFGEKTYTKIWLNFLFVLLFRNIKLKFIIKYIYLNNSLLYKKKLGCLVDTLFDQGPQETLNVETLNVEESAIRLPAKQPTKIGDTN